MFKRLRWKWYIHRIIKMDKGGLDNTDEYKKTVKKFRKLNMYFVEKECRGSH